MTISEPSRSNILAQSSSAGSSSLAFMTDNNVHKVGDGSMIAHIYVFP